MRNPIQIVFWLMVVADLLQFTAGLGTHGSSDFAVAIEHAILHSSPYALGCRIGAH